MWTLRDGQARQLPDAIEADLVRVSSGMVTSNDGNVYYLLLPAGELNFQAAAGDALYETVRAALDLPGNAVLSVSMGSDQLPEWNVIDGEVIVGYPTSFEDLDIEEGAKLHATVNMTPWVWANSVGEPDMTGEETSNPELESIFGIVQAVAGQDSEVEETANSGVVFVCDGFPFPESAEAVLHFLRGGDNTHMPVLPGTGPVPLGEWDPADPADRVDWEGSAPWRDISYLNAVGSIHACLPERESHSHFCQTRSWGSTFTNRTGAPQAVSPTLV